jgi:hypothetical protein
MPDKSNQKTPDVKPDKKSVAKPVLPQPLPEKNHDDDSQSRFPTSLNEELDEHLKKNSKRFFGGCG